MATTKIKERLYIELDNKKKEYKNNIKNNSNNYNELLKIEREIKFRNRKTRQ